jgi:hypothetical protein
MLAPCSISTEPPGIAQSDHNTTDYVDNGHYDIYAYNGCPAHNSAYGKHR